MNFREHPPTREAFTNPQARHSRQYSQEAKARDHMVGYVHVTAQGGNWVEEESAEAAKKDPQ